MRRLLLCLLLVPAVPVWAVDVPVSYTVDDKALKAAVSGTPLTFTLYSDSACTTSVHTQVVNSENVRVISKLKRFNPTGAAKPPKTDELATTLTGVVPASAPLYLQVTGTGITPVGGACQVQASGMPGGVGSAPTPPAPPPPPVPTPTPTPRPVLKLTKKAEHRQGEGRHRAAVLAPGPQHWERGRAGMCACATACPTGSPTRARAERRSRAAPRASPGRRCAPAARRRSP